VILLDNARAAARLATDLPRFLRERLTTDQCIATVRAQRARREASFLEIVQELVFDRPDGPYLPLFRHAGLEVGDVAGLVAKEGLEGALRRLHAAGVYLTYEEFKGRREVERGSGRFMFHETDFDNPRVRAHFSTRTGGTTGRSITAPIDLRHVAYESALRGLAYAAHGVVGSPVAQWMPVPPDSTGFRRLLLENKIASRPPERWFAPTALTDRMGTAGLLALTAIGKCMGQSFPWPEHVPSDRADIPAGWLASASARAGTAVLVGFASPALAAARSAQSQGLDLTGGVFSVTGEPITPARLAQLTRTGARVIQTYVASEVGHLGISCPSPDHADDLHLVTDVISVGQHEREHHGMRVLPLLFTTLHPLARKVLINVETDDTGVLEERSCGCLLEQIGFTTHVHGVRSFGKLTTEGMTVLNADLVRIAEELLPARFGGAVGHYQFMESEAPDGLMHVTLLVDPEVGGVDPALVVQTVLDDLKKGRPGYQLAAEVWRQAETVRVDRRKPIATARGKVLPLYIIQKTDRSKTGGSVHGA
jgi:hypothetical protein